MRSVKTKSTRSKATLYAFLVLTLGLMGWNNCGGSATGVDLVAFFNTGVIPEEIVSQQTWLCNSTVLTEEDLERLVLSQSFLLGVNDSGIPKDGQEVVITRNANIENNGDTTFTAQVSCSPDTGSPVDVINTFLCEVPFNTNSCGGNCQLDCQLNQVIDAEAFTGDSICRILVPLQAGLVGVCALGGDSAPEACAGAILTTGLAPCTGFLPIPAPGPGDGDGDGDGDKDFCNDSYCDSLGGGCGTTSGGDEICDVDACDPFGSFPHSVECSDEQNPDGVGEDICQALAEDAGVDPIEATCQDVGGGIHCCVDVSGGGGDNCGDGICDFPTENHFTCPADCLLNPDFQTSSCASSCGDGICTVLENDEIGFPETYCPDDCEGFLPVVPAMDCRLALELCAEADGFDCVDTNDACNQLFGRGGLAPAFCSVDSKTGASCCVPGEPPAKNDNGCTPPDPRSGPQPDGVCDDTEKLDPNSCISDCHCGNGEFESDLEACDFVPGGRGEIPEGCGLEEACNRETCECAALGCDFDFECDFNESGDTCSDCVGTCGNGICGEAFELDPTFGCPADCVNCDGDGICEPLNGETNSDSGCGLFGGPVCDPPLCFDCPFLNCGNRVCDVAEGETTANCTDCFCGDGIQDDSEACDDGNNDPGDGCDENCQIEGVCTADDVIGITNGCIDDSFCAADAFCNQDTCLCEGGFCNDLDKPEAGHALNTPCGLADFFIVNPGCENSGSVCNPETNCCECDGTCDNPKPYCAPLDPEFPQFGLGDCDAGLGPGSGILDSGECDPTNPCAADCAGNPACDIKDSCGDGIAQDSLGEACDDGNTTDGDGCSSTCQLELNCGESISCQEASEIADQNRILCDFDLGTLDPDCCEVLVGGSFCENNPGPGAGCCIVPRR